MDILLVSHFHWDREWYRTFDEFRGRLVDAVDAVLDLVAADPEFRFVLDGQAIVLEDYLAIRPQRREELAAAIGSDRIAAGPWYVQPDSLLPSGEAHVRNLLAGRAVVREFGPVSRVAYVPDSFGHPAQFPQIFAGYSASTPSLWAYCTDATDKALVGGDGGAKLAAGQCQNESYIIHLQSIASDAPAPAGWTGLTPSGGFTFYYLLTPR